MTRRLVLASTSAYRAELLRRLTAAFEQRAPQVDESAGAGETPRALAVRLAETKARAVAAHCVDALVIGSDQTAELNGAVLGKPGGAAAARAQLQHSSGREVLFHTAWCLLDTRDGRLQRGCDLTRVRFRSLDAAEIARYVEREQPLDCAGSFKSEGLGIALFERIESEDPTALIGLPLIALTHALRICGLPLP